jgi:hypothetical protein
MKFWYQSYSKVGYEKKWSYYEEAFRRHVPKVVRPGTEVHLHGIEKNAPKKSYFSSSMIMIYYWRSKSIIMYSM